MLRDLPCGVPKPKRRWDAALPRGRGVWLYLHATVASGVQQGRQCSALDFRAAAEQGQRPKGNGHRPPLDRERGSGAWHSRDGRVKLRELGQPKRLSLETRNAESSSEKRSLRVGSRVVSERFLSLLKPAHWLTISASLVNPTLASRGRAELSFTAPRSELSCQLSRSC